MSQGAHAKPLLSIVTPVYDPPLDVLQDTMDSVRAQTFEDWEWILVDDASPSPGVLAALHAAADSDPRFKIVARESNGHIVAASNDGLRVAQGEFVVFMDHDDLLTPQALQSVVDKLRTDPELDYIYTDEDKYSPEGLRFDAFHKPDWSPERLRGQMYSGHLSVARKSVLDQIGGFRSGYDGSQDHDLTLRLTEVSRKIGHVPDICYHWRAVPGSAAMDTTAKPYAYEAGLRAVNDHLERVGIAGTARAIPSYPGQIRIDRDLSPEVMVSIIIPTSGESALIWGTERVHVLEAVRSALAHTMHENLEIVVAHVATPDAVLKKLKSLVGSRLVLVRCAKNSLSEQTNLGFAASSGHRIVLLHDDVEILSDKWLEHLVAPLDEPDVGLTGSRHYAVDSTLAHVGYKYENGHMSQPYRGIQGTFPGILGEVIINREVSGVSPACTAIRRETFAEVGGLSEYLPSFAHGMDLSLKVRSLGLRVLYIASCELHHFESPREAVGSEDHELGLLRKRWGTHRVDGYQRSGA